MNCIKCGNLVQANEKFCNSCGEPASRPAAEENALRAVWLAAAALGLICIAGFFSVWQQDYTACILLFYFICGCALYLFVSGGLKFKIAAGCILISASFLLAYAVSMSRVMSSSFSYNPAAAFNSFFADRFFYYLFLSIIISVTGIAISLVPFDSRKNKLILAGLSGAFVYAAYANVRFLMLSAPLFVLLPERVLTLAHAAVILLSLCAVNMFCNMQSRKIITGAGHKIWFVLCVLFSSVNLIVQTAIEISNRRPIALRENSFVIFLLTAVGIMGYVKLCSSKRSGYMYILMSIGLIFFINFNINLSAVLRTLAQSSRLHPGALSSLGLSFTILINPFITGLLLLGPWKTIPEDTGISLNTVSGGDKIFSIVGLASSFIIFFTGALNIYGVSQTAIRELWVFFAFFIPGTIFLVIQFLYASACFGKNAGIGKGLSAAGRVCTIFSLMFVALICFGLIYTAVNA
ncbi:MAG: hypothetical protein FWE82_02005 [Defluviitaleaceae bacterium]|nr:hypothetical protein [Defluviitaleaceae bacterium]